MNRIQLWLVVAIFGVSPFGADRAWSGEQEGVQCPAEFKAEISDANRALKCVKKAAFRLDSSCEYKDYFSDEQADGTDRCYRLRGALFYPSFPSLALPGYPPKSEFRRVILKGQRDFFAADDFRQPDKFPPYIGMGQSAKLGVHCPSGWDGDVVFGGNGIRCDKYESSPVEADCDLGWTVDRDRLGQEDRCLGINEGPTKPMGMTKIQFDLQRALSTVGWVLEKRTGTDLWRKKVYRYPDTVQ